MGAWLVSVRRLGQCSVEFLWWNAEGVNQENKC